jgi:hypothetical protein
MRLVRHREESAAIISNTTFMRHQRLLTALLVAFATVPAIAGGDARLVHPNPFSSGGTTFTLSMPAAGRVRIIVYDMLGRQVRNLTESQNEFPQGEFAIKWDGNDQFGDPVPAGAYVCVLWTWDGAMINSVKVVKTPGLN